MSTAVGIEIYWEGCLARSWHHRDEGLVKRDDLLGAMYFLECNFALNFSY